ncbi:hypothetical protein AQUCO_03400024v1 [Aquilegia coerulea]|uniref:RING-type E3 ubiquitin transferase n=1 Tax=Aquilegia coerulea TaxID=218851 RepID=A0A2G5CX43_AQUCA|nr:hypothetical protein AQUCO_03400024v1 [Aquilegia coerulea]
MAKTGVLDSDAVVMMKVTELKKELERLVKAIVIDEEDFCKEEVFDRGIETMLALKDWKFKKSLKFPQHFRCPISNELMRDPVILATGQTYERQFIQAWLDAGFRTCPQTQQVLSHTNLIPNNLVQDMISQWCKDRGIELPKPVQSTHDQCITKGEKECFDSLIKKVVSPSLPEQKLAAKELRSLTKRMPSFRTLFGENRDAIPKLLRPLSMCRADFHPDLQEDLITTVLNLSILDENKKLVAETSEAIPLLIESLRTGTIETRTNAAAALFTLSALDSNKSIIGLAGALKPLIDLLEEGHQLAMKDAASAIFNLCILHENKARAVRDGAVKVIMQKIKDRVHVDELLAILAILSGHQKAVEEMSELGAVSCLLSIIRENTCGRSKENSIAILYSISYNDRSKLREIREEENVNGTISQLTQNGTSRARRKANGILERLNRTAVPTHTA